MTMKPEHVVEAALFSAGRPLAIEDIRDQTGLTKAQITKAIKSLVAAYEERDTVLEIGPAGTKWGMQVRTKAAEPAAKFAPMEIPKKTLKTLALIAYHQPMKQSELSEMVGSKVYDHVRELKEHGLIKSRRDGHTKILSTTPAFPEYFGLAAATPEEIRTALAKAVGLDPNAERKRAEKAVESFNQAEPTAPDVSVDPSGGVDATPVEAPPAATEGEVAPDAPVLEAEN